MLVLDHTPYFEKQIVEHVVASHATNTVPRANYRSVEPQSGPTPHEIVIRGPHVVLDMVLQVFTHLSTHVIRNYLPIKIVSPCGQPNPTPWVSIPPKLHLHVDMP
jgi:hypothetical protein